MLSRTVYKKKEDKHEFHFSTHFSQYDKLN